MTEKRYILYWRVEYKLLSLPYDPILTKTMYPYQPVLPCHSFTLWLIKSKLTMFKFVKGPTNPYPCCWNEKIRYNTEQIYKLEKNTIGVKKTEMSFLSLISWCFVIQSSLFNPRLLMAAPSELDQQGFALLYIRRLSFTTFLL